MANMSLKKNPMPSQDPNVRNKNFDEVALGYTEEQALDEAQRCLHCKNKPCMQGCPVMVHIPDFIAEVAKGDFEAAYQIIAATSALPAVCGRVCPQESQCEKYCVRGIKGEPVGIGRLERFVADWHREHASGAAEKPASNGHRVAVVGSGPSGLTCAGDLARKGYDVTVFEALHLAGGVLVYGIPEFRLPKTIVQKEVDGLKELGVTIATDTVIGRTITVDELMEELRMKGITDLNSIKYAILETNGQISVLPYAAQQPVTAAQMELHPKEPGLPLVIINDGRVLQKNLRRCGRDEAWLQSVLKREKHTAGEIFLLTVDENGKTLCIPKEDRP